MFSLQFDEKVKKDFRKISREVQSFILDSLEIFVQNFSEDYEKELLRSGKLKFLKGDLNGFYRLRVRSYRVIFRKEGEELIIFVVRIAHRKEIY